MAIAIRPETEARLERKALGEGRDLDSIVDELLTVGLDICELDPLDVPTAIQEGLDAVNEGRVKPLPQYLEEQRLKHGYGPDWPASDRVREVNLVNSCLNERP